VAIKLGDALLRFGIDTAELEAGMKGVTGTIQKHHKAIGIAMTAAGATILAGFGVSINAAADFEAAMREVNTMMGLTTEELAGMSDEVLELSSSMGLDAVESAKALYQAISAGVPKENVLDFLRIASEAAIGGVTSTEVAVDGLTTVLNAFKMPMSEVRNVADLMFTTVKGGKTTFGELSASLFQIAPIASASGVSFQEVSAALATLTKQGTPTKIAAVQLRQALVQLQKPTADMEIAMKNLGYTSGQAMIEELGFAETINILTKSVEGDNKALIKMFGSIEAAQGIIGLTGQNVEMFTADLNAMADAEGASMAAFEEMMLSNKTQIAIMKEGFDALVITIGDAIIPAFMEIVNFVKPIIQKVVEFAKENKGLTAGLAKVVAVVGVVLATLGPLMIMLPMLIAGFHALMGPIGWVILGLTAVSAAAMALWLNWDKVWGFIQNVISGVKIKILTDLSQIMGGLRAFAGWIPGIGDKIAKDAEKINGMLNAEVAKREARKMVEVIRTQLEEQKAAAMTYYDNLREAATTSFNKKKDLISEELAAEQSAHDTKIGLLRSEYDEKIRTMNAEASAEISRIQGQIDAIDEATEHENRIIRERARKTRQIELETAVFEAADDEKKAEAQKALDAYLVSINRERLLEERSDYKNALRDEMEDIRQKAIDDTERLKEELEEKITFQQAALVLVKEDYEIREALATIAFKKEMADLVASQEAVKLSFDERLTEANLYQTALEKTLKDVNQTVTTTYVTKRVSSGGSSSGDERSIGDKVDDMIRDFTPDNMLATGGIAMKRMDATIAEKGPEAVIPLSKLESVLGSGKKADIRVYLDKQVLVEALGQALVDTIIMRTGG